MKFDDRLTIMPRALWKRSCAVSVTGLALFVAGCSSDVSRFEQPPFGLTDGTGGGISRPSQPMAGTTGSGGQSSLDQSQNSQFGNSGSRNFGARNLQPPVSGAHESVRTAALPDIQERSPVIVRTRYEPTSGSSESSVEARSVVAPTDGGQAAQEIQVQRGDTLYGLSRRHSVSLNALMQANGLTKPDLKPGQTLKLPAGAIAGSAPVGRTVAPRTTVTVAPVNSPKTWNGSYTMVSGDSLYKVARKFGIKTADLQRFNGIDNPRQMRPGTILKVPGTGSGNGSSVASAKRPVSPIQTARLSEPNKPSALSGSGNSSGIAVINSKSDTGTGSPRVVQSVSVAPPKITAADSTKLRWPARGKVISKFGRRSDGTQNDGINLEVPLGTDVKAAEKGVVAYSGSELRGYGKLVLVRHENGWVTAYAHNKDVLVKRGDKVARGQVIAKAGKTGQVDRPQVHFELRRDAKPVDPIPYLETL